MSHRSLRIVGQPPHVILVDQAAHFRLMRNHLVPPFFLSACCGRVGDRRSLSRRAFSFRDGSCVFGRRGTAPWSGRATCRSCDAVGVRRRRACCSTRAGPSGSGLQRALRGGISYAATGSRKPRFVIWIVQDIRPPFQIGGRKPAGDEAVLSTSTTEPCQGELSLSGPDEDDFANRIERLCGAVA